MRKIVTVVAAVAVATGGAGYVAGEVSGYKGGHADGYAAGRLHGYAKGQEEGETRARGVLAQWDSSARFCVTQPLTHPCHLLLPADADVYGYLTVDDVLDPGM